MTQSAAARGASIVVGYAERSWPRLLRDLRDGGLAPRHDQEPDLSTWPASRCRIGAYFRHATLDGGAA